MALARSSWVPCYLCGAEYLDNCVGKHEVICYERHMDRWNTMVPHQRAAPPLPPPKRSEGPLSVEVASRYERYTAGHKSPLRSSSPSYRVVSAPSDGRRFCVDDSSGVRARRTASRAMPTVLFAPPGCPVPSLLHVNPVPPPPVSSPVYAPPPQASASSPSRFPASLATSGFGETERPPVNVETYHVEETPRSAAPVVSPARGWKAVPPPSASVTTDSTTQRSVSPSTFAEGSQEPVLLHTGPRPPSPPFEPRQVTKESSSPYPPGRPQLQVDAVPRREMMYRSAPNGSNTQAPRSPSMRSISLGSPGRRLEPRANDRTMMARRLDFFHRHQGHHVHHRPLPSGAQLPPSPCATLFSPPLGIPPCVFPHAPGTACPPPPAVDVAMMPAPAAVPDPRWDVSIVDVAMMPAPAAVPDPRWDVSMEMVADLDYGYSTSRLHKKKQRSRSRSRHKHSRPRARR